MDIPKLPSASRAIIWIIGGCLLGVFLNILFLILIQNTTQNIKLLRGELSSLEQNQRIIQTAQEVYVAHEGDVTLLSKVFPAEEKLPDFLAELESTLGASLSGYTMKFNSIQPIPEADKLYLLMTISGYGSMEKLDELLTNLEQMPYMTHIVKITGKTENSLNGVNELTLVLKVYVQNPFTHK